MNKLTKPPARVRVSPPAILTSTVDLDARGERVKVDGDVAPDATRLAQHQIVRQRVVGRRGDPRSKHARRTAWEAISLSFSLSLSLSPLSLSLSPSH